MASFFKEMSRKFAGFTEEDRVSLTDGIRTGHPPTQFTRVIAVFTVVGQPVLMTRTAKGISCLPPMSRQPVVGHGVLIVEASRPHTQIHHTR
jgi:hypothetical protein